MAELNEIVNAVKDVGKETADEILGRTSTNILKYPKIIGQQRIPFLQIKPKKLLSQTFIVGTEGTLKDRTSDIKSSDYNTILQIALLKEGEISENFSHRWEEADINSLITKGEQAQRVMEETIGVAKSIFKSKNAAISKLSEKNAWTKTDAALIYKGSARRTYTFRVGLVTQTDPYEDVIKPIRLLQSYSCPEDVKGNIFKINPPAIFEISIIPSQFIQIKNAALVDLQVNYSPHFHFVNPLYQQLTTLGGMLKTYDNDGYPKMAEISLTFLDLMPLYRKYVGSGDVRGRVTIKSTVNQVKNIAENKIKEKIPDVHTGPFNRTSLDDLKDKFIPGA